MQHAVCGVHSKMLRLLCRALQYLGTQRAQMRKLVKPTGKRLWMSEFGCGSSPPSDMGAALELSAMIMRVCSTHEWRCTLMHTYIQHRQMVPLTALWHLFYQPMLPGCINHLCWYCA